MKRNYVPGRGDIVWLEFDPKAGHEQSGTRPALVLSPASYNGKTGLMLACPITNQVKGYPFEVSLGGAKTSGVILSDHVKSLDWKARNAAFAERAAAEIVSEVLAKLSVLLED